MPKYDLITIAFWQFCGWCTVYIMSHTPVTQLKVPCQNMAIKCISAAKYYSRNVWFLHTECMVIKCYQRWLACLINCQCSFLSTVMWKWKIHPMKIVIHFQYIWAATLDLHLNNACRWRRYTWTSEKMNIKHFPTYGVPPLPVPPLHTHEITNQMVPIRCQWLEPLPGVWHPSCPELQSTEIMLCMLIGTLCRGSVRPLHSVWQQSPGPPVGCQHRQFLYWRIGKLSIEVSRQMDHDHGSTSSTASAALVHCSVESGRQHSAGWKASAIGC